MFFEHKLPSTKTEYFMNKYAISILMGMLFSNSAAASDWQSLGRLNALTQFPDVQNCQQRVINHFTNPRVFYYPNSVDDSPSDDIELMFNVDVHSLIEMTTTSATNSTLKNAYNDYVNRSGLKSIDVSVWPGRYTTVSINVSSIDPRTPVSRDIRYYPIAQSARQFYELQQFCPL
jgi:hypothetical protein